jgi:MFS family permease
MHQISNNPPLRAPKIHLARAREIKSQLGIFSWEGAFGNIFIILTGGAFLTSMGIYFGASDVEIGLLGAIPFMAQAAQLLAPWLIHLSGARKRLTVLGFLLARQIWLLLIPLLFVSAAWNLTAFLAIAAISSILAMVATPGWISWIADIVPGRIRGRYFARRNSAIAITTVAATIIGGLILDHFKLIGKESIGYSLIIGIGCIFALISTLMLIRLPENGKESTKIPHRFADIIAPLKDKHFRYLLKIFFVWNMAIGISAIFFAAHMLTNLKMSFLLISMYTASVALSGVFMNRFWGMVIDKVGSRTVLAFCAFGISFIPLIWLFPSEDFIWILGIESIYTGALWSGFNLAAFNVPIANSPQSQRTSYLAMFSVVTGLGFFISSLLGGLLAETFSGFNLTIGDHAFGNYHILFLISALLRILTSFFIMTFHEPGEKSIPVMIQFMGYAALKQISVGRQIFPHRVTKKQIQNAGEI